MARVVALMDDLFFQMKLAETAKQLGVEVKVATNADALLGLLQPLPRLVIVDLNSRSQPIQAIERVRAAQPDLPVIGFLSHVQRDLAAQAQSAGCSEVMPRSAFTQRLADILGVARDKPHD
jgi:DNA-binding NarL/FixJ family response regulator